MNLQIFSILLIIPYVAIMWQCLELTFIKICDIHILHGHVITRKEQWMKSFGLANIGGAIYVLIEILYRGYSHWTMYLLGGACFIQIGVINEVMQWTTPIEIQVLIGTAIATVNELVAGMIINIGLGLHVWDYSDQPFNLLGQICALFVFFWIFIVIIAIFTDDILRYYLYKEERPRYYTKIFKKTFTLPIPYRKDPDNWCDQH